MSTPPRIPDIPVADVRDPASMQRFVDAVREILQIREGRRGQPLDEAVTFRDLTDLNLAERTAGGSWLGLGGQPGPAGPAGPQGPAGDPYVPDFTAPPTPANLRGVSLFKGALIEWDAPTYTQGHGNAYTEVYVAQYGGTGPLPTFAAAVAVGKTGSVGTIYMHGAAMGAQLHIWAKHVTNDGIESATPAGGTNGVQVTIGKVGNADLGALIVEADNLASGAVTATKLANAAVGLTAFAAGIEPVTIVVGSTVPTTKSTNTIYLTGTGKMYRWEGAAYTASVPTSDLSGTVVQAQIADGAINTAKFAAGLEPVSVVSSVPGTLSTRSIFNTADGKLYRWNGAAYVATVPAGDLTGVVGGGNLVPNSGFRTHSGGMPTFWSSYNNGGISVTRAVSTGGLRGQNFVRVTANATVTQQLGWLVTGVDWQGGQVHWISFWARSAGAAAVGALMTAQYANHGWDSFTNVSMPGLQNGTWQLYVFRAVPTAGHPQLADRQLFISWVVGGAGITSLASGAALDVGLVQVEIADAPSSWAPKPDEILPGTITTTEIADDAITTPKLVAGSVVTGKIAAGAVTANELAANSVVAGKVAANAITAGTIAAGAVTAAEIAAGAVTTAKLAAGAVTANEIAAGSVTTIKLAAGAVTANELAAGSVTADKILANAITAGKIAAGAVSAAQIAAGAISTDKLLVTGRGAALNSDPMAADPSAWAGDGQFVTSVTDSPNGGRTAVQNPPGLFVEQFANDLIPVDSARRYLIEVSAKREAGTTANSYLGIVWYDAAGNYLQSNLAQPTGAGFPTGWANGAYSYWGLVDQTPPATWTRYTQSFGPGEAAAIPSNARFMKFVALLNYSGSAGAVVRITALRISIKADADLIVDGSIIATKIAAGAIAVGSAAIANGAIRNALIENLAVDSAKLADASVGTAKIQDAAIVDAKIANLSAEKITAGTLSADRIGANSITAGKIDSRGLAIRDAAGNVVFSSGTPLPSDAAVAWGFNPTFSAWSGAYPDNWGVWGGTTPVKETSIIQAGTPFSVRWVTTGGNTGMAASYLFANSPLAAGSFISGSFSMAMIANAGGGSPGYMFRLFTDAAFSTYVDTPVAITNKTVSGWQRMTFTAGAGGAQIFGITVYQMASWDGLPGGQMAAGSEVVFGPIMFDVRTPINAANASTWIANAAIGTAQIADASITSAKIQSLSVAQLSTALNGGVTSGNYTTMETNKITVFSGGVRRVRIGDLS